MLVRMWPFSRRNAHRIRSSTPYWLLRDGTGDAREALTSSMACDVAIVGAGITGTLIADALVGTGLRIVLLDSRDVALGSTAATTALLQYEIDTPLTELTRRLGAARATQAYQACASSFAILERRFPELLRLSNYQPRPSLYLAADERAIPGLRAELEARRAIGLSCEWLDAAQLEQRVRCRRPGGILSTLGAMLDPVRFTQSLMASLERHGVRMFARSPVEAIQPLGEGLRLEVRGGLRVDAAHVVVAAGFESVDFLPRKVADINNTYALVTEPLADRGRVESLPLLWETARPYLYVRGTPDGRLLVGGADVPFKSAAARDALLPRQVGRLATQYRDLFGEDLPPMAYAWGGSFAATRDGLPYIGRVPGMHPRLQFALCYGGNGITYSVLAGEMVRAGIERVAHPLEEVFGFSQVRDIV
jgi:glycine/D-amino acid oxidase-like deaminating enzyme